MDERLTKVLHGLIRSTESNRVSWKEGISKNQFEAHFPDMSVQISEGMGEYLLRILNKNGTVVEEIGTTIFSFPMQTEMKPQLRELYGLARRQALKVDQTLDKLIRSLD